MGAKMPPDDPEFASRAAQIATNEIEKNLISATRSYEDAVRDGDEALAAAALQDYAVYKHQYDALTGGGQQQQHQPSGQLSTAQRNFLSRRAAGGDELTAERMNQYAQGHQRAVSAGLKPDSPEYFKAVEFYVDHQGDGRIPPLDEREAARISGISEQEYAAGAAKLRALKAAGHYQD